jgi:hypothetical protein
LGVGVNNFYSVLFKDDKRLGVAYAEGDLSFDFLLSINETSQWSKLVFDLEDGDYADYLANDLGWRLCSSKLISIFDQFRGKRDGFIFLPVEVKKRGNIANYYVLHFPKPSDVLDADASKFAGDLVIKPVLDREKVSEHCVFAYGNEVEVTRFVVSDRIKKIIQSQDCTGIEFSKMMLK